MIRLTDVLSISPVTLRTVRNLQDQVEREFNLGAMMDRVNRRSSNSVLLTTFDATHSGMLVNNRVYPGSRVRDSIYTWTRPYPKPVLDRHIPRDLKPGEQGPKTYGRARRSEFVQLVDEQMLMSDWKRPASRPNGANLEDLRNRGSGFIKLQTAITDPSAIEEILDMRFLTVSSGMDTNHLYCSACGSDWAFHGGRCDHKPGVSYGLEDGDGSSGPMFFVTGLLFYDHLARVDVPAQPYSTVLNAEFIEAGEVEKLFSGGEVIDGFFSNMRLIDSREGPLDLLFETEQRLSRQEDPTVRWTPNDWAEARVLDHLARNSRLSDQALNKTRTIIDTYRTSERKPVVGPPKFMLGSTTPIHSPLDATALLKFINDGYMRGSNLTQLKSCALECADLLKTEVGGPTMPVPNDPAKEWADIVAMSEGLDDAQCNDWSDFQEDLFELTYEEAEAEAQGAALGIIAQDAKLTAASRKKLPDSAFCGPSRSFPVHDAAHVRNALSRLPQSTRFSPAQKARILACVRRAAKRQGVTVGNDELKYEALLDMLKGTAATSEPTADQKKADDQLGAAKAKIEDQDAKINKLIDENKNLRAEVHKGLAERVFEIKMKLGKPDVKVLDSLEKKQEFVGKLTLRTTESLKDSLADLVRELETPSPTQLADQSQTKDPTAGVDDPPAKPPAEGNNTPPKPAVTQEEKFQKALEGYTK